MKALCDALIGEVDDAGNRVWSVSGFRMPEFFKEAFEAGKYRSDLIVFDWDYGDGVDPIQELRFILESSHAHVIIFTGTDKKSDIETVLNDELNKFLGRVELLEKEVDDSSQHLRLLEIIKEKQLNNFAFKFSAELRSAVNQSLDGVLHRLAALDISKVIKILAEHDNDPVDADLKEMIGEKLKEKIKASEHFKRLVASGAIDEGASSEVLEVVAEVIKTDIASLELDHTAEGQTALNDDDAKIMEELWSYRLYHHPSDGVVRSGDIMVAEGGDFSELLLVLTPPCDLARFWKATDGCLAVLKLSEILDQDFTLRDRAKRFKGLGDIRGKLKGGASVADKWRGLERTTPRQTVSNSISPSW